MSKTGQGGMPRVPDAKEAMELWLASYDLAEAEKERESVLRNALGAACQYFLPGGIEGVIIGAAPARQFLVKAKELVSYALLTGIEPFLGLPPADCLKYNDNDALDHYHGIAYWTRYLADVLLDAGDPADLRLGMQHLERLIRETSGLSGDIAVSRARILALYLWFGILARSCDAPLEAAASYTGGKMTAASRITSYKQEHAYVRMLYLVARYAAGDQAFHKAARGSLRSLLSLHLEQWLVSSRHVLWPSKVHEFTWAWLWESVFEPRPDANHAIEILRGNVELG